MYILNDIELLSMLCRHKIFPIQHQLSVTDVKLGQYSYSLSREIISYPFINVLSLGENFGSYLVSKRKSYPTISIGDISTMHKAMEKSLEVVVSNDDTLLCECCHQEKISCIAIDELISRRVKDERTISLYNILKQTA